MLILVLCLFLVVIVLGLKARSQPKFKTPAVLTALVAGGLGIYHVATSAPEGRLPIDIPPEEALGYVLAQRVLEDYPEGGKVIVFQAETDEERLLTIFTARMAGIQRALGDTFEIIPRGPLLRYGSLEDRQAWFQMETGFPLAVFQQWASTDRDAVAAISMLGMPGGRITEKAGLPPMYVAELRGVAWDPSKLPKGVAAIVTYRSDRAADPARAKELLDVFEQNFVMYPAVVPGDATPAAP